MPPSWLPARRSRRKSSASAGPPWPSPNPAPVRTPATSRPPPRKTVMITSSTARRSTSPPAAAQVMWWYGPISTRPRARPASNLSSCPRTCPACNWCAWKRRWASVPPTRQPSPSPTSACRPETCWVRRKSRTRRKASAGSCRPSTTPVRQWPPCPWACPAPRWT